MKKFFLLFFCFVVFFVSASKAQTTSVPFNTLPGGITPAYLHIYNSPMTNFEDDAVFYDLVDVPEGITLLSTQLEIVAHGNVSGDIYLTTTTYQSGNSCDFEWNTVDFQALYPDDTFTVEYIWEADFTDGTNIYIQGSDDTWGGL